MNYQEALEFIGEVRAGMSWELFCIHGVRHSGVFIDILNDTEGARNFLSSTGISGEYISGQIKNILYRLHFNRENDHYLTLALPHNASGTQIHKHWKELMLLYHPDRNRDEQAAACAGKINDAYSVLKNPEKKMEYDRKMQSLAEGHHLRQETRKFRTPPPKEHIIRSPRMRSILSKLIIPSCALIAGVILLIIFLENRQVRYLDHAAVTDKGDSRQQTPEKEKGEIQEEVKAKVEESRQVKAEVKVQENTQREAQVKAQKQAKIQVQAQEQVKEKAQENPQVKEQVKEKEKTQVETREDAKAFALAPKDKVEGEARIANDLEVSVRRPSEKSPEMPGEKVVRPAPVQQAVDVAKPQDVLRTEPEKIDRSVNLFISQYTRAYEEGDIEKFMSLFSRAAVENGRMNYDEIRKAYKHNFEKNRYRYTLKNVQFRKNGDDVTVAASYIINKSADAGLVQGDIRWTLAREGVALKVLRVDYERK